jgi:hypothetical protein
LQPGKARGTQRKCVLGERGRAVGNELVDARILIVEDDRDTLEIMRIILSRSSDA